MTDLKLTNACAEAMGYVFVEENKHASGIIVRGIVSDASRYDPLHDDAQAMALVKKFLLTIDRPDDDGDWSATHFDKDGNNPTCGCSKGLNRAIVQCIARLHKERP